MRIKFFYNTLLVVAFITPRLSISQCPINSLGQNPSRAFPVCGTSNFVQVSVNLCGGKIIQNIKCTTNVLRDVNPYWYKFTCFEAGTLGFIIEPNSNQSDYDWQVFDITGRDPADVYNDKTFGVSSNWSGYSGITGTSPAAANLFECDGDVPKLSKMPLLVKGHQYLLLVSHFTENQEGYRLYFGGGTASITDTIPPRLEAIYARCQGKFIGIKLNKRMRCNSLAANGSDFSISSPTVNIIGASAATCSTGFDMDSLQIILDDYLPIGNYTISVKTGTDNNTILDYCDNALKVGEGISVDVLQSLPTLMDSIRPLLCKPANFYLDFKDPILCNSIAANGSDFVVSGPSEVTVTTASGTCVGGVSKSVMVQLSGPIQVGGVYTITLQKGSDGNTLLNECVKETPAGSKLILRAYDTVSAAINYNIASSCSNDTLKLFNAGRVSINSWKWYFDDGSRTTQGVQRVYNGGTKIIGLKVSNGVCEDSATVTINFDKNRVKASFIAPTLVCPLDTAFFENTSTGPITGWNWDFGNGVTSRQQQPGYQYYPVQNTLLRYFCKLTVTAANGCSDNISQTILVPGNCYIAVPNAFTPNSDGLNDFLYPLNAYKATNLDFKVYNRYGQLVWQTTDWTRKWDGRINGNLQASGTYVWHLTYIDPDKGKKIDLKGLTSLIR